METILPGSRLGQFLNWCLDHEVSDIHLQTGKEPWVRIHGSLQPVKQSGLMTHTSMEFFALFVDQFSRDSLARIESCREYDCSFQCDGQRWRANFARQRGLHSLSLRHVPVQQLSLEEMQLPDSLHDIVRVQRGLVLLTGPTGQGKSTTARALLQEINRHEARRIISIEDPIEYLFEDGLSLFEQREVGTDTDSFAMGIRNAMRQDPDILFVGEMRDPESVYAALQACETGHLVVTTLHADSTAQALSRVLEFHPLEQQHSLRRLLARNLRAVVSQRLISNLGGTRTPCLEILIGDGTSRKAIVNDELELLVDILEVSNHCGMHSFDQYLMELFSAGIISRETLMDYAANPHAIDLRLRGIKTHPSILKP